MEAELDLQPASSISAGQDHWSPCWWLQRIITILNPLPSWEENTPSFLVGHPPTKEAGK